MKSDFTKIFASRFKSLRNNKELTQAEAAEELNCSQQAIVVWENENGFPKI